ncbi:hypothetical protein QQ045_012499 [Rhodiola kirilowii]
MYAVGRLIGRSINTVSGPFHPFGGAVDIVVVEQPDGSFKSSPWYVRFGKFQGVLKTREKVVSICVDGVEADFHMYLDHTGEAYFLEEVEEEILLESSSSSELKYEQSNTSKPMKSLSCNFDAEGSHLARSESVASESAVTSTESKRSRLLGMVWSRRLSQDEPSPNVSRASSLGQAEIVANLLDVNWSTELATDKPNPQKSSHLSKNLVSSDECDGDGDSIAENNVVSTSVAGSLVQEPSGLLPELSQYFCQLQIGNAGDEGERKENVRPLSDGDSPSLDSAEKLFEMNSLQDLPTAVTEESVETLKVPQSNGFIPECEVKLIKSNKSYYSLQNSSNYFLSVDDNNTDCEETTIVEKSCNLKVSIDSQSTSVEDAGLTNRHTISSSLDIIHQSETDQNIKDGSHEDELFLFSDDELKPNEDRKRSSSASSSVNKEMDTLTSVGDIDSHETLDKHVITSHASLTSLDMGHQEDAQKKFEDLLEKEQQKTFFPIDFQGFHDANTEIDERMVESLPNLWSHIDSLEADHQPRHSFDATTTSPRWLNPRNSISSPRKPSEEIGLDFDKSQPTVTDEALLEAPISDSVSFGVGDPSKTIVVPSGTWRLWPFSFQRATSSKSTAPSVNPSSKTISSSDVSHSTESISSSNSVKSEVKRQVIKKKMRTITPTSAQLKSLKLKDGGNIVTFTFSTAMLGKQQVDARIYLWKWNARIVISDVDGTITRSDVLGQFMPMVGYDWSHIGVTHLFSAIKENGYQLLFLSARSISQSHLTRQFLFNLKQDGKALPDGPVVISPDGLFPSLFREVIRRAPHEFKIACLEDIRALYPADCNPFYAGFGNRDTDEISYLRVGIPEGKIFIINPRGEVAVHRRVDTNSYSDLHTLVSGMFPPNRSSEQEAFNSWNFWKLPPRMDYNI